METILHFFSIKELLRNLITSKIFFKCCPTRLIIWTNRKIDIDLTNRESSIQFLVPGSSNGTWDSIRGRSKSNRGLRPSLGRLKQMNFRSYQHICEGVRYYQTFHSKCYHCEQGCGSASGKTDLDPQIHLGKTDPDQDIGKQFLWVLFPLFSLVYISVFLKRL